MATDDPFQDIFDFQIVDPRDISQGPDTDAVYGVDTPSLPNSVGPNVTPNEATDGTPGGPVSEKRHNSRRKQLTLLQLAEWD